MLGGAVGWEVQRTGCDRRAARKACGKKCSDDVFGLALAGRAGFNVRRFRLALVLELVAHKPGRQGSTAHECWVINQGATMRCESKRLSSCRAGTVVPDITARRLRGRSRVAQLTPLAGVS